MRALGRLFNAISSPTTTDTYVALKDCSTVTLLAVGASGTQNVTVTIAKDAAGTGAVAFTGADSAHGDGIAVYWSQTGGVWTKHTQAVASTFPTTAGTGDIAATEINSGALPDGYKYVKADHANATLVFLLADLEVQRSPDNLRNPTA